MLVEDNHQNPLAGVEVTVSIGPLSPNPAVLGGIRPVLGPRLSRMPAAAFHVGIFLKLSERSHVHAHICGKVLPRNLEALYQPFHAAIREK